MKSTLQKSNTNYELFKTYIDTWSIFECISTDTYKILKDQLEFLKKLVCTFSLKGDLKELRVICTNYKNAEKMMKELEGKIDYGLIELYKHSV